MTRPELHGIQGFHPGSLLAAAIHLRVNIPRKRGGDATERIGNGEYMNGFLDAIEMLERAASPLPPETPKKEYQPYSPPRTHQSQPPENPNQK